MKRRIRRHPAVAEDLTSVAVYIAEQNLPAAIRFLDNAEVTLKWLVNHPGFGSLRDFDDPRLAVVRSWPVKGFRNHLILYEIEKMEFISLRYCTEHATFRALWERESRRLDLLMLAYRGNPRFR